ncbi:interleukin-10 receptor subunit beta [Chelonoidis abingdonii]|uniref:interleukin-10 receptor subunit beta n=1 Tax=Chelonoidis abingdonii TaxID=106734 RepID=UPI0013F229FF|nr:interleukin-10 receptor subunit beta isoform X1 [Chelonoidis abingdonii]
MARRFLALVAGCLLCSAFGIVPEPKNVTINSVNLKSTLQWDPPTVHKENITYTVESISSLYNRNMCVNIVITECDFSSLPVYGEYTLRVRAESENEKSGWVNIIFKPLDDTIIGPPDVKVKSESGSLHVDFTGPVAVQESHVWPLNKYYGSWVYRVLYWKKGNSEEVITTDTKYNSEILSGLDPWTIYCLQVQAVIPEWNKTGKLSEEFCDRTTDNGVTPVWIILTVLLVSTLVVLVSVPACFFIFSYIYRQARYVFCPTYSFPQHLKEFLSKPSYSSQFLSPHSPEEDHSFDKLTVISEESENCSDETSNRKEQLQDSQEESSIAEKVSAFEKGPSSVLYLIQAENRYPNRQLNTTLY